MAAPFYPAIKGTTGGTPGTGAFTPNAADSGFRAWSAVPAGWVGLVRYEDGSDWELSYSYWNGTTLSRGTNQRFDSSTGSILSLTSAATAAMVPDPSEVMSHLGGVPWRMYNPLIGANTVNAFGLAAVSVTGTGAGASLATTNYLTEQPRVQITSATTANAAAGWTSGSANIALYSTSAGRGGFDFTQRFGASQLPTAPKLFVGMATGGSSYTGSGEPSSWSASSRAAFTKDSGDTNIQLLTNDSSATANKVDTGIAWAVNGWYEVTIWAEPGGGEICGLLVRLDTGAIWFGRTTTKLPVNGTLFTPQATGTLSATTGTALILHLGAMMIRTGS